MPAIHKQKIGTIVFFCIDENEKFVILILTLYMKKLPFYVLSILGMGNILAAAPQYGAKEWESLISFERDAAGTPSGSDWNNVLIATTPAPVTNANIKNTGGSSIGSLSTTTIAATGVGPDWKAGSGNLNAGNIFPSGVTGSAGYQTAAQQSFWNANNFNNPTTITFSGLSAGWYSLDVLSARNNGNLAGAMSLSANCNTVTYYSMGTTGGQASGVWSSAMILDNATTVDPFAFMTGNHGATNNGSAVYAAFQGFFVGEGGTLTLTLYSSSNTEGGAITNNNSALNYMSLTKYANLPEPATVTLGLFGMVAFAMRRRRHA